MAKVSFAKLGLTKNQEVKKLQWNDQIIDIKQYLSIGEKIEVISRIVAMTVDENGCYNPSKIDIFSTLEIFLAYTGISFTEKQKEDVLKLYDLIVGSGLLSKVYELIPESEINYIKDNALQQVQNIYNYKNSALGILEAVARDYNDTVFDAKVIKDSLNGDKESLKVVKDVISKMG